MRLKHILRRLTQTPLFTLVTIATLALGIGANSAIFSVVNGVLLKPLPYPHPESLIGLWFAAPGVNIKEIESCPSMHYTFRDEGRSFDGLGMYSDTTVSITGLAEPEEVRSIFLTQGTFETLGAAPEMGRLFSANDDAPNAAGTVILSYGFWRSKFGGDRGIVGRSIKIDGVLREVIGVMPERFRFLNRKPAVYLTLRLDPNRVTLGNFSYQGFARMKPGVKIEQASADVARMLPMVWSRYKAPEGFSVKMFEEARFTPILRPLMRDVVGDIAGVLWVLMGTIGIVLLIACANVANLMLVRASARQQELAIRASLGAGWGQIAREMLLESLVLGIAGGIAGLALAWGALKLLLRIDPGNLPRLENIAIDGWTVGFTFAISVIAGVLFGLIPVFKYARPYLAGALRGGGRTLTEGRERHRARNVLVVVQVALALVLLIGSGLMIRTFQSLRHVDPGFRNAEQLQTFRLTFPNSLTPDAVKTARMMQEIMEKLGAIPGVNSVGLSTIVPMDGSGWHDPIYAEDRTYREAEVPPLRTFRFVSPGLFATMGNRLIAGRDFTWTDAYETRAVTIITENLARELWRDPQAALGKRIRETTASAWREVIGVINDERDDGIDQKAPGIAFWPILTSNFSGRGVSIQRSMAFIVRSPRAGTESFLNEIRQAVWSVNANLPLAAVRTLQEVYDRSLARTSFTLVMLAIAGGMALLLGVIGIYGVISYSVSQRTREIGIRIALGARNSAVTGLFLRHGVALAGIGVAIGLGAAMLVTKAMSSLLFGVNAVDPPTFAVVALGLIASAALASYLPSLRATRIDPASALRE